MMKMRSFVRLMAKLTGIVDICAGLFMVTAAIVSVVSKDMPAFYAVLVILLALVVIVSGVCVLVIARSFGRRRKGNFVLQQAENGTIGVSLNAIEKQVYACVGKHDLIQKAEVSIAEGRDGLIIQLYVDQVSGVNIPLSVGLLQKQIRQYVTSCSGVDVQEVQVMVENGTENTVESPYVVQDVVMAEAQRGITEQTAVSVETEEETVQSEETEAAVVSVAAAPVVVLPPLPAMPEYEEEDDRPLHQRLFGAEEEPVTVPAPPVMTQEEAAEEEISLEVELDTEAADDEVNGSDEEDLLSTLY